jgi:hypothetical protein
MKWVKHDKTINRTSSLVKVAMGLLRPVSLTGVPMALFFSQFFISPMLQFFSQNLGFALKKQKEFKFVSNAF